MRRPPHLGACGIGHVLGSCIMVVPAYASDNTGLEFQQFIDEFAGKKDFFEFMASVAFAAFAYRQVEEAKLATEQAKRQADEAFKASPEGKIRAAVAKAMEPFEPTRKEDEVIKRPEMDTIKERIKSWRYNATILGGRFQSGKSVAVEEALRGVRGVVRFTIESANWKTVMFEQEELDNAGQFKKVMCRVREKLKDFPDNLTKYPILLLDIPRRTTVGQSVFFWFCFLSVVWCILSVMFFLVTVNVFARSSWQGIDEISTTAKVLASDQQGAAVHAPQLKSYVQIVQTQKRSREG